METLQLCEEHLPANVDEEHRERLEFLRWLVSVYKRLRWRGSDENGRE